MSFILVFIILFALLNCANCDIICTKQESNLICLSDDQYNTMQRGTVSDDETIRSILLFGCGITSIEPDSFNNLPNLDNLDLSFNILTTLTLGTFDLLSNLQSLNITRNLISDIPNGLFNDLVALRILDLSNNQISEISPGVFSTNEELHQLLLAKNLLQELPLELFDKNPQITHLDLSYNKLSELPDGIFDNLKNLRTLDLSSNRLLFIQPELFSYNTLLKLHLSDTGLQDIPEGYINVFQQLLLLDLSKNNISNLREDIFGALINVKNLNLSSNQLSEITNISELPQLVTLDVSRNKLQYLPMFKSGTIKTIDISHNLFTNFGTNLGMLLPRKINVFRVHGNPWQCSCLKQLLDVLQRRKISYSVSPYFNGKRPVCVISPKKGARCFRDPSQDRYFINTYFAGLQKYQKVNK